MVNSAEVDAAIDSLMRYKSELQAGQIMQRNGFHIPNTRMSEFIAVVDSASRRAITALEIRDPDRLETLGELCLNASRSIKSGQWK